MDNWLKYYREKKGYSQDDLARELNLLGQNWSRSSISNWETGKFHLPLEEIEFRQALAKVLGISLAELLFAAGYEVSGDYDPQAIQAAELVMRIQPENRGLALRVLEQFTSGQAR